MGCCIPCSIGCGNFFSGTITPVGEKRSVDKEIEALKKCSLGRFGKHFIQSRAKALVAMPFAMWCFTTYGVKFLVKGVVGTICAGLTVLCSPKTAKECIMLPVKDGKLALITGGFVLSGPIAIISPEFTTKILRTDKLYRKCMWIENGGKKEPNITPEVREYMPNLEWNWDKCKFEY